MTITTTQVSTEDALWAVANGKNVQMIWMNDGKPFFSNLTEKVLDCMKVGEAFLIVEIDEGESVSIHPESESEQAETVSNDSKSVSNDSKTVSNDENAEKIASSQQDFADTCENAAEVPETVVTDPDTTPITVEIPNSHKAEKERQRKLDDERIIALRKSGLSEFKIAEAMDSSQNTIHYHIAKLKKEGRL